VREGAADERQVGQSPRLDVVHEATPAAQQAAVLEPTDALAYHFPEAASMASSAIRSTGSPLTVS
jgi:hypothetical protein